MRKYFVSLLVLICMFTVVSKSFAQRKSLLSALNLESPKVYKPSKLVIGEKNKFIIKAEAGSSINFAVATGNVGSPKYFGKQLRLSEDIKVIEGKVEQNGVGEIYFELPNDETLIGEARFFEVITWKKDDFSDLQVAQIMSIGGQKTNYNRIVISGPPTDGSGASFSPLMPGLAPAIGDVVKEVDNEISEEDGLTIDKYNLQYDSTTPVILRNLKSVELKDAK